MTNRTKINLLIRLITLTTGLVIGGGVSASVIEVNAKTSPVIGHAPVVNDVTFDKTTPAVNDTVTATPTMTDADNDTLEASLYQWQLDGKDIPKATQNSYKLQSGDDNGKRLTVKVTPQTNPAITDPAIGAIFTSSVITTQGFAPEALDLKIDGTPDVGQTLTGHYRYNDRDSPSDPEDISSTRVEWICERSGAKKNRALTKTYTLQDIDGGCDISFNVTPHAQSGTPRIGAQVQSKVINIPYALTWPHIRISNGAKTGEFNIEIDYAHLGRGVPKNIRTTENIKEKWDKTYSQRYAHSYKINDKTSSGSTVTDDGHTIRYSERSKAVEWAPSTYIGKIIQVDINLDFEKSGLGSRSAQLTLQ